MSETNTNNVVFYGEPASVFALYQAIGKAQSEFKDIPKNKAGQFGNQKFDYAPYHVIRKCILPALTENGVAIMQPTHTEGEKVAVTLIVSGHGAAISSTIVFDKNQTGTDRFTKEVKFDVQLFGREHTYWRRYQLQSFFCLEGDKDADDPSEAVPNEPKPEASKRVATEKAAERKADAVVAEAKKPDNAGKASVERTAVNSGDSRSINEKLMDAKKQLKWEMSDFDAFCHENITSFPGFISALKMTSEEKLTLYNLLVETKGVAPY